MLTFASGLTTTGMICVSVTAANEPFAPAGDVAVTVMFAEPGAIPVIVAVGLVPELPLTDATAGLLLTKE